MAVTTRAKAAEELSLSEAMQDVGADLAHLVRQEVQLAKAELAEEVRRAARGAGLLAGAGFAAVMAVLLGSFASAYGLGSHLGLGWGTLVVAGTWLLVALGFLVAGRRAIRRMSPTPRRTVESLKEDARWARHPLS